MKIKTMNEKESLAIIKSMIHASKQNYSSQAPIYLLWGWLVLAAAILELFLIYIVEFQWHFIVWPIIMGLGTIISMVMGARSEKKSGSRTYVDRAMSFLWSGWAIFLIIILYSAFMLNISWGEAYALIIGFYGMGTFVSGGILSFKPLIYGGAASFVIALICVFLKVTDSFPFMLIALSISVIVSYLVPGYLLRKS